ncbi:MAG: DUF5119 domain-containing protein [Rikenellaceae bacterium]
MKSTLYTTALILSLIANSSCIRRSLTDYVCQRETATIPVTVDWTQSGITPSDDSRTETDYVHRVSLRFFPLDGSTPFDRYLETNIYEGEITLPEGSYSIVAFNESIYDTYWNGYINFINTEDYDTFAVELVDEEGDGVATSPLKLASWSLGEYTITEDMISTTKAATPIEVTLQPLTCYTTVTAQITNLSSAQTVTATASGLTDRMYMASGEAHTSTTSHSLALSTVEWDDDSEQHGSISARILTFDNSTDTNATYTLEFDVILVDGTRHTPDEPLIFDVSHQITRYATDDFSLSAEFEIPETSGSIEVDEWGDKTTINLF